MVSGQNKKRLSKRLPPALARLAIGGRNLIFRAIRFLWRHRPPTVRREEVPFIAQALIPARFLIGTLSGLLYYDGERLFRFFDGKVYGITRRGERWYVFRENRMRLASGWGREKGQILSFVMRDGRPVDLKMELHDIDPEVHQIDFFDDCLYIADTANNRLSRHATLPNGKLGPPEMAYPNGRLAQGKQSPNYVHLNSVFCDGGHVYLVYHNQTQRTGKKSEIVILDRQLRLIERIDIPASCAHNIVVRGQNRWYCDSQGGALLRDGQVVFHSEHYVRGLAIHPGLILLGGSEFAKREDRINKRGYIFALDPATMRAFATMFIPSSGSIFEIRFVDRHDLGLSAVTEA
jgi:hypothetical protein